MATNWACLFIAVIANILADVTLEKTAKKGAISAKIICTCYINKRVSCHYYFFPYWFIQKPQSLHEKKWFCYGNKIRDNK